MSRRKSEIDEYLEYYKKINNELVIPSYRKFCKENKLHFHFWDEISNKLFDPKIAHKQMKLQKEAMDLFNKMKKYYEYFDGKIFRFSFTDWGGGFEKDEYSIQDFMELTENLEKNFHREQNINKVFVVIASFSTVITLFAIFYIIAQVLSLKSNFFNILFVLISFGLGLSLESITKLYFNKREMKHQQTLKKRILELRQKLAS